MIKDLLLIQTPDMGALMEDYRLFFAGLLPAAFMIALIVEHVTAINPEGLLKRAAISVLLLSCVTVFYHKSVAASMEAADAALRLQKIKNPLLMDMLGGKAHTLRIDKSAGNERFFKKGGFFKGVLKFFKYHLFASPVNDAFTLGVMFVTKICFVILKIVYSLVYWLGFALFGIPCLIHLLPGMAGVLRGALVSFLWCLILPHVLVVILSVLGSEINRGYAAGAIIGDSVAGTALLFVMALTVAFVPLITSFILSGGGVSHAGSVIAAMGVNLAANLPKRFAGRAANALVTKALPSYRPNRRGRNNFERQNQNRGTATTTTTNHKGEKFYDNNNTNRQRSTGQKTRDKRTGETARGESASTKGIRTERNRTLPKHDRNREGGEKTRPRNRGHRSRTANVRIDRRIHPERPRRRKGV